MTRYTVTMSWGETWTLTADFNSAASPIEADGEPVPYQVADAGHSPQRAAELVVQWWDAEGDYLGEDGHILDVTEE